MAPRSEWALGTLILFAWAWCPAQDVDHSAPPAAVSGRVLDAQAIPVVGSVVVPLDRSTGFPLAVSSGRPLRRDQLDSIENEIVFARTDHLGQFELTLLPGEYRLIAQTWGDGSGVEAGVLAVNGPRVRLDGIAEHVRVDEKASDEIVLRPAGTSGVSLDLDLPNDDTLFLVSREPLAGDPVLGFASWSGSFWSGLLAGNRMPDGKTHLTGLPAGVVHLAFFANDNQPGFGAATIELEPGIITEVSVPIIAAWSDGHKDPPERLRPLTERFLADRDLARQVRHLILERMEVAQRPLEGPWDASQRLIPLLGEQLELPEGTIAPIADVAAALAYARMVHP